MTSFKSLTLTKSLREHFPDVGGGATVVDNGGIYAIGKRAWHRRVWQALQRATYLPGPVIEPERIEPIAYDLDQVPVLYWRKREVELIRTEGNHLATGQAEVWVVAGSYTRIVSLEEVWIHDRLSGRQIGRIKP